MTFAAAKISSLQNQAIKRVVSLRQRSHRDTTGLMIIEGYREIKRFLDNNFHPVQFFFCRQMFLGSNEDALIARAELAGAELFDCSGPVFEKIAYRERPEGLLAIAPQIKTGLNDIKLSVNPLVVVAESIEKPGNLGTLLRSSDAAGVDAVIICDRCTDINNPNVIRASIGTIFSLPVAEATTSDTISWLTTNKIRALAATPHTETIYTEVDMIKPTAIVLGTEQYGLSEAWMNRADLKVKIPMKGQADSLNVAAAATILLYEAVRQRG